MKRRSTCNILVIEPSQEIQAMFTSILVNDGCDVTGVSSAHAAAEKIAHQHYQIVICRNILPDKTALDLYMSVREQILKKGTAFFMIIGKSEFEDFIRGAESGIDNFIQFPVDQTEVIKKVRNQLLKIEEYDVFETEHFKDFFHASEVPMFVIERGLITEMNMTFSKTHKARRKRLLNSSFFDLLNNNQDYTNLSRLYRLNKGFIRSCNLEKVKLSNDSDDLFDIFLYKDKNTNGGKILAMVSFSKIGGKKVRDLEKIPEGQNSIPFQETNVSENRIQRELNFTEREYEIYLLSARGMAIKQIASELNLSRRTVEKHRSNIMQKTNAHNMIEVIQNVQKVISVNQSE